MENNSRQNPHLASILQNLERLTQGPTATQYPYPNDVSPTQSHALQTQPAQILPASTYSAPSRRDPQRLAKPPRPDPTKITQWPPAVKFVMKNLSQDPEVASKIRQLVKNQHDNERRWWTGREALVSKHKGRVEGEKKVDDLLRSLGGASNAQNVEHPAWSAKEAKDELQRYDKKVYAALGHMVAAMDKELTTLMVPFFAVKHDLVHDGGLDGKPGTITKKELADLQRKMLQLLQDLFGD